MYIDTATIGNVVDKYIKIFFQLNEESELVGNSFFITVIY